MTRLSCILAIIGIALMCVFAQERYSDQYDYIDVKAILTNDKLRLQYYDCFMGTRPCATADAKFFKDIVFEAIANNCQKCSERQKEMLGQFSDWYMKNDLDRWGKLIAKSEDFKKNAGR